MHGEGRGMGGEPGVQITCVVCSPLQVYNAGQVRLSDRCVDISVGLK